MEPQPHLLRGLGTPVDARAVDLRVRGRPTTAVYRLVEAQSDLRAGGRTLGTRLGIYQLLQALPLGEWVCVDALTEREQRILPALPPWTRVRRNRHILRLADTPVRLDALLARGNTWKEALDRACALGRVAPGTAVCPPLGSDREQACWEADFYGVGLAEHDGEQVKVLVHPSTTVPEPVVALHWRLAEHIHRVVIERATSSARFCPVGQ